MLVVSQRVPNIRLVVRHRMRIKDGGQMFLIDCKRHIFTVTRCSTIDDITVVTVRRNS